MFCKQLLGVRRKTSNDAVLQEIGLLPISLHITKIAIRNWDRIMDKKANPLLLASHFDAFNENLPWSSEVKEIFNRTPVSPSFFLSEDFEAGNTTLKKGTEIYAVDKIPLRNKALQNVNILLQTNSGKKTIPRAVSPRM